MKISHVIRGEDHLSNTANQAALYNACSATLPIFWHLPIICNAEGKKLSKRDFGFSLRDLVTAGYLPEAICNYLGILGASFPQEIMTLEELAQAYQFEHVSTTGHIKYDVEKLRWVNHKWINRLTHAELTSRALPFLVATYPAAADLEQATLERLITHVQTDLITLVDAATALSFYFERPAQPTIEELATLAGEHLKALRTLVTQHDNLLADPVAFALAIKQSATEQKIPLKVVFTTLRRALQGTTHGLALHDLIAILGEKEARARLKDLLA
jgi:glutamyl/glutaminyl-tRNA synthetase